MPAALAPKAAKPGEHHPALGTAQGAGAGSRLRTHGEHPKEDGTGGKALPKAPARSLIHPIAEMGMQLWKDSGTALEKGGISPKSNIRFTRAAKACWKIKRRRVKTCMHVVAVSKA